MEHFPSLPPQAQAGMGALGLSPDGIGAMLSIDPTRAARAPSTALGPPPAPLAISRGVPPEATVHYHGQPLGYEAPIEPKDTSTSAAVQSAGITSVLVAVAIGAGVVAGGVWGAGAGLMLAGALANGYRAQKWMDSNNASERHEAVVSATFGVGELVLGGYLAYRAYKDKHG